MPPEGLVKRRLAALLCSLVLMLASPAMAQTAPAAPSNDALASLIRSKIKHVFVIYQENRSFDSYFGTFPGAENLSSAFANAAGFKQYDPLGNQWVTPFRITTPDTSDADHSRRSLLTKSDDGKMDLFVSTEEAGLLARNYDRDDAQKIGLLTMAHEDCDTVPYLWMYASHFTLFDHFFQGMYGPSTPGNIDLIAAQTGQTQWARDNIGMVDNFGTGPGIPLVNDVWPAWGPYPNTPPAPINRQYDQTYATVMLSLSGKDAGNARKDDDDIKQDVGAIRATRHDAIPWGWYQEGFKGKSPDRTSFSYIVHHNAVQYFGYLRNNPYFWRGVHDLKDLLPAIQHETLGDKGVIFVKGGYSNTLGLKPADKSGYVQTNFLGDDDHPGYSDSHISQAMVATYVNAIAKSKYWNDSLILIVWDDSEGLYDHVPPPQFERCPDGRPCGDGPRVPAIIISPFAKDHAVVSDVADHSSFAKLLSKVFDIPSLGSLPDEKPYLPEGPRDTDPRLSDLLGAFDIERLSGPKLPIPAEQAIVPEIGVPPKMSCSSLGIAPVHIAGEDTSPAGFAPIVQEH
jgi:phospholipase C